jgi:thiol-disulfide isomerase/thioredoxin
VDSVTTEEDVIPADGEQRPQPSGKPGRGRLSSILSWGLILALIGGFLWLASEEGKGPAIPRGEAAPPFTADKLGGGTLSMDELRGRVVLLDFWATWCPPCIKEMPILTRLAKEYEDRGLAFVAASRDDPPERAKVQVSLFVDKKVPELRPYVVFASDKMAAAYGVQALPMLFLIDRQGKIVDTLRGYASEELLRERIERALQATP